MAQTVNSIKQYLSKWFWYETPSARSPQALLQNKLQVFISYITDMILQKQFIFMHTIYIELPKSWACLLKWKLSDLFPNSHPLEFIVAINCANRWKMIIVGQLMANIAKSNKIWQGGEPPNIRQKKSYSRKDRDGYSLIITLLFFW